MVEYSYSIYEMPGFREGDTMYCVTCNLATERVGPVWFADYPYRKAGDRREDSCVVYRPCGGCGKDMPYVLRGPSGHAPVESHPDLRVSKEVPPHTRG